MAFSKCKFSTRNSLATLAVLAAVSIQISCGDQDKNKPTPVSRRLAPNAKTGTPAAGPSVEKKPIGTPTTKTPLDTKVNPTLTADLQKIVDLETAETTAGKPIHRDELLDGTYTLNSVRSSYHYLKMNTQSGGDFRAIHSSVVKLDAQDKLPEHTNGSAAGKEPLDENGRKLELPITFTLDKAGDRWSDLSLKATNLKLINIVRGGKLEDTFQDDSPLKASVLAILASDPDKDGALSIKDEQGVPVTLHLLRPDDQSLRVWVSFEEATGEITKTRNIFLDYKFEPVKPTAVPTPTPAPAPAPAPAPGA